jgi:ABC-type uncharacterized transport system involved in gliding motility auxiliary subunit
MSPKAKIKNVSFGKNASDSLMGKDGLMGFRKKDAVRRFFA